MLPAIFSAFSSKSVALSTGKRCIKARVFSSTSFIANSLAARASSGVFGVLSSCAGSGGCSSMGSSAGGGAGSSSATGAAGAVASACASAGGSLSVLWATGAEAATFLAASSILFRSCWCSRSCCFQSFSPALSAEFSATRFSSFIDFTSNLPPSSRSSTSHLPNLCGCGSRLCTTPRLPFRYGALRRPCIRTIAFVTRSVEGPRGGSALRGSGMLGAAAATGEAAGMVSTAAEP
mmetsp:Transcript_35565/g.81509  ORF Transcript_35565/g.81509 Transcript_35565/m.81509 type:complete len:235 (-) Transcript_35565:774-1478(-)